MTSHARRYSRVHEFRTRKAAESYKPRHRRTSVRDFAIAVERAMKLIGRAS